MGDHACSFTYRSLNSPCEHRLVTFLSPVTSPVSISFSIAAGNRIHSSRPLEPAVFPARYGIDWKQCRQRCSCSLLERIP